MFVDVGGLKGIGKDIAVFKAFVGVFGEGFLDDVVDGGWDGGIPKAHGGWIFVAVCEEDFEDSFSREGELSCGELVEGDTEGVDIDAVVNLGAFGLFGGKVSGCTEEDTFFGLPFGVVEKFGDAEVKDFGDGLSFAVFDEDVGGFEVAVDDALAVGVVDDFKDWEKQGFEVGESEASAMLFGVGREVESINPIHDDAEDALLIDQVETTDKMGMTQSELELGFAMKASAFFGGLTVFLEENFDRDGLGHVDVFSSVHKGHPSAPDAFKESVLSDLSSDQIMRFNPHTAVPALLLEFFWWE